MLDELLVLAGLFSVDEVEQRNIDAREDVMLTREQEIRIQMKVTGNCVQYGREHGEALLIERSRGSRRINEIELRGVEQGDQRRPRLLECRLGGEEKLSESALRGQCWREHLIDPSG